MDGEALKYFSDIKLFTISKNQIGNRNYLLIGYEDSDKLETYSDAVLCSSNNYRSTRIIFNSFGDSMGERNDVYRLFRNDKISSVLIDKAADFIIKIIGKKVTSNELTSDEKEIYEFFNDIGYFKTREFIELNVPVFTKMNMVEVKKTSQYVIELIKEEVINAFDNLVQECQSLSVIKHKVPIEEIANEMWHQLFGNINEYLAKKLFFENPKHIEGEGRYFQSIHLRKNLDL